MKYDAVTEALIAGAKLKRRIDILSDEILTRLRSEPTNLPRYGVLDDSLTYQEFIKKHGKKPRLNHQIPQCHICTRFETDDNPLFAYSFVENENGFRFIYRCRQNHGHDFDMTFIDILTGLKVHCS